MDNSLVEDASIVDVKYIFDFKNGDSKSFSIHADLLSKTPVLYTKDPPAWTELNFHKCPHCPLSHEKDRYCPAALSITDIVEYFSRNPKDEESKCTVVLPDKYIVGEKHIYESISSLLGLRFATSQCPILQEFRLMVRFHEPFTSPFYTVYRATSMYLLKQYFKKSNGESPDWELKGLKDFYEMIAVTNRKMGERLKETGSKHCAPCSMTVLNVLTLAMTLLIDEHLEILKELDRS